MRVVALGKGPLPSVDTVRNTRSLRAPRGHEVGTSEEVPEAPRPLSSGDVEAFYQTTEPVRTVTSGVLGEKLRREAFLTEEEGKRLDEVFRVGSTIQAGIDARRSAAERQKFQRQLIDQIRVRLDLLLRDARRVELARAELSGLPRIDVQ